MAKKFTPRLDILPGPQRRLWDELGAVPPSFILYGGTAIALQLGHRQSVDFDFFGSQSFDPDALVKAAPFLRDAEIVQRAADTLTARIDRDGVVLVSFFGLPEISQIEVPLVAAGGEVKVAGLIDLAGMKASVVQKRALGKDYLDIAALIGAGISLSTALAAARAIYGSSFNPQITLKALSYFGDGDLANLPTETKRTLQDAVRAVDLNTLPTLATKGRP